MRYFQTDICCLCLKEQLNKAFYPLFDVNEDLKICYYDKLVEIFSLKIFDPDYDCADLIICKKCSEIVDLVYEFHKNCFKRMAIFFSYKKLLGADTQEKNNLFVKLEDYKKSKITLEIEDEYETDNSNADPEFCDGSKLSISDDKEQYKTIFKTIKTQKNKYTCQICSETFTFKRTWSKHEIREHGIKHDHEKKYRCNICEAQFSNKTTIREHLLIHSDKKPFNCEICQKYFRFRTNLRRHKLIHNGVKKYQCNICSAKFLLKDHLNNHFLTHSISKTFVCEICNKSYGSASNYYRHKRIKHGNKKSYVCPICSKTFPIKQFLDHHVAIHNYTFACDLCPKKFALKQNLQNHRSVHFDEKPFSCSHCPKKFRLKIRLKNHELIHTGIKAFSCKFCPLKFYLQSDLHKHNKRRHIDKKFECNDCDKVFGYQRELIKHKKIHKQIKEDESDEDVESN